MTSSKSPGFTVRSDQPVLKNAFDQMHVELEALQEVGHQPTWNRTNAFEKIIAMPAIVLTKFYKVMGIYFNSTSTFYLIHYLPASFQVEVERLNSLARLHGSRKLA